MGKINSVEFVEMASAVMPVWDNPQMYDYYYDMAKTLYITLSESKEPGTSKTSRKPLSKRQLVCFNNCVNSLNDRNYASCWNEFLCMIENFDEYKNEKYLSQNEIDIYKKTLRMIIAGIENKK